MGLKSADRAELTRQLEAAVRAGFTTDVQLIIHAGFATFADPVGDEATDV